MIFPTYLDSNPTTFFPPLIVDTETSHAQKKKKVAALENLQKLVGDIKKQLQVNVIHCFPM